MKKRVLLGMSGGVDSSVCAMMLQEKGYEVIGITFLFSGNDKKCKELSNFAKDLALKLNIKHHTIDLRKEFESTVIKYFKEEYLKGNTPFPCAYCNPNLKFYYLNLYSLKFECDLISTGHYAKIVNDDNFNYISKGEDPEKDQSFFLWGLNSKIIDKLILPIGKIEKRQVRNFAEQMGFELLSKKKDSLGVCFIEGNDYRKYLKKEGIESQKGNFVDINGNIIGSHKGILNYTIGQRRGLELNINKPIFVCEINKESNEIVLSDYKDLYKIKLCLNEVHFNNVNKIDPDKQFIVKIRYRLQETPCTITLLDNKNAVVNLLEPLAMIAKGQTAVFYDGDRVVGGGFIESSE